jgi:hypothetical protein
MAWILNLCLSVVMIVCILMSLTSGLWGNLIMIFNVIMAGLIATNYFEPLAGWLDSQMPSYTYLCDFIAFWAIFALSVVVLRAITDTLSRVKVRFKKPLEMGGGLFAGAILGWVMVCLVLFSLHTAPLGYTFFRDGFNPETKMYFGMGPDQQWGGFAGGQSDADNGPLTAGVKFDMPTYRVWYAARRANFEKESELRTKG